MLNLTPRPAPPPVPGSRDLSIATWNSTGSDNPAKLEQIALLAWGDAQQAAHDIVVIQEFAQRPTKYAPDYKQLCDAFDQQGWGWHKTDDEGPQATSSGCYFLVWNQRRLTGRVGPLFITDLTAPVASRPKISSSGRTIYKPKPFDAGYIETENNPPLALRFSANVPGVATHIPVYLYTWHVSQDNASARVPFWPGAPDATVGRMPLGEFTKRARIMVEMQRASNGAGVLLLAGDLNVDRDALTSGRQPLFPRGKGFRVVSGGGSGWDHVIACYGNTLTTQKRQPGQRLGAHKPLAAILTL